MASGDLGDELLQRDAVERQLLRVGLDADLLRTAAGNVGQADVVDLHEFGAQLVGELVQILVGPARRPPPASATG